MDDVQKKPKGAGKGSFDLIDSNILTQILSIKPGSTLLDLACGRGAYSIFLYEIVGEAGLIYAVDLWKEGLMALEKEIQTRGITNILTLMADATEEIDIDDHSVDLCLMATVLHDFEEIDKAGVVLNMHDREIRLDNGWVIKIGRGLDDPPETWNLVFEVEANDLGLGKYFETKVDIFNTGQARLHLLL